MEQELPGEQWTPSNADVGLTFISNWCGFCARDRVMREGGHISDQVDDNERCDIIGRSFYGEAVEWRRVPPNRVICVAYVEVGQPVPPPRCAHTPDMFEARP